MLRVHDTCSICCTLLPELREDGPVMLKSRSPGRTSAARVFHTTYRAQEYKAAKLQGCNDTRMQGYRMQAKRPATGGKRHA